MYFSFLRTSWDPTLGITSVLKFFFFFLTQLCSSVTISDHSREFSGGLGNVAWKERVDGWRMKQDKNSVHGHTVTNGTSHPPSEGRGVGDIDATTDYNMDDDLLLVTLSLDLFHGHSENFSMPFHIFIFLLRKFSCHAEMTRHASLFQGRCLSLHLG